MRPRAELGEDLTLLEFFYGAVVVVIGQNPGEQVNDCRVALMTMQADMSAGCNRGAAETQLAVLHAVNLLGEIDAGEQILGNQLVVGRRRLLPQYITGRQQHKTRGSVCCGATNGIHCYSPFIYTLFRAMTPVVISDVSRYRKPEHGEL